MAIQASGKNDKTYNIQADIEKSFANSALCKKNWVQSVFLCQYFLPNINDREAKIFAINIALFQFRFKILYWTQYMGIHRKSRVWNPDGFIELYNNKTSHCAFWPLLCIGENKLG